MLATDGSLSGHCVRHEWERSVTVTGHLYALQKRRASDLRSATVSELFTFTNKQKRPGPRHSRISWKIV